MAHLMVSQQMPQSMVGQPPPLAIGQPTGPNPSNVPHGYGMPTQSAQTSQSGQQSNAEQKYDLISRVRHLVLTLKESLAVSVVSLFVNKIIDEMN